jgi:HSP20 family protein
MSLVPRKIFYDDDFWDDFMPSVKNDEMKCDIYEKGDKTFIEMDIPGYKKEDINVDVHNNYLNITAKKEEHHEDKDKNYIRRERSYGKISRSFYIGDIKENDIDASFKDGILTVSVPKEPKENNHKKIEIK